MTRRVRLAIWWWRWTQWVGYRIAGLPERIYGISVTVYDKRETEDDDA